MNAMTETRPAAVETAEVKEGMIAYLQVNGAMKAAEFYQRALGAKLLFALPVDDKGRTMHVHLHINGSSVMLCDGCRSPATRRSSRRGSTCCLTWTTLTPGGNAQSMPALKLSCRSRRCSGAHAMARFAIHLASSGR